MEIVINAFLPVESGRTPEALRSMIEVVGGRLLAVGAKKVSCRLATAENLKKGQRHWGPGIFFLRRHYPDGINGWPEEDDIIMRDVLGKNAPLALQAIIEPPSTATLESARCVAAMETAQGLKGALIAEYDIRLQGRTFGAERGIGDF